ncbi:Uncharacterised protein [Candidatus Anstonella stagnisolia]|nr:Uncharacterised protein [Candidatus Anstonella stagnisolia]
MKQINTLFVIALFVFGFSFAQGVNDVTNTAGQLCDGVKGILPVAAMLMVVLAGVIYAAGQVMGAETRARANVWATAALTGALISVLIVVVAPPVLNAIYPGVSGCAGCQVPIAGNCGGNNGCCASGACVQGTCQCTAQGADVVAGIPCCAGLQQVNGKCEVAQQQPQCGGNGQACCANAPACQNGLQCNGNNVCAAPAQCAAPNVQCGANCVVPADQCNGGCPCVGNMPVCGAAGCRAAGLGAYGDSCGLAGDANCGPNGELYACNNNFCGGNGQRTAACGGAHDLQCTGNLVSCNNNGCGGNGQLGATCGSSADQQCTGGNCVNNVCTAACVQAGAACVGAGAGNCCQNQFNDIICTGNKCCANFAGNGQCTSNSECCMIGAFNVCIPDQLNGAVKHCRVKNGNNGFCDEDADCANAGAQCVGGRCNR